jgi:hypothetical protein
MANIKDHVIYESITDQLGLGEGGESLPVQYGEANDGANVGNQGVGPYDGKTGVTLNFRNIAPGSSKCTVTHDEPNKNILIDFVTSALQHQDLGGAGAFTHAQIDAYLNLMAELAAETRERTGFENRTDSAMSFDNGTRTFTIQPVGDNFVFYQNDVKYTKGAPDTIVLTNVTGLYLIYYDGGVLGSIQNPDAGQLDEAIRRKVLVAYVYWNSPQNAQYYFGEERHQFMPNITHSYLHFTRGTQFLAGGALNSIIADGSGALNSHAQFGIDASQMVDEDLFLDLSAVVSTTSFPVYYLTGTEASPVLRRKSPDGYPLVTTGTGRMAYNQLTGGNWQLTEVTNTKFALVHVFLTNDLNYSGPIVLLGQNQYDTLSAAREGAETELGNLITQGLTFSEFVAAATVIYQTADSYTNTPKSRIRSTDLGDDYIDWRGSNVNPVAGPPSAVPESEIFRVHHTGLLDGGALAINTDTTKFDVAAGNGVIVDYTDPNNPAKTEVSWASQAAITTTGIATNDITAVFVNSSGTVVQSTAPSESDYRDKIFLGLLVHVDRTNIDQAQNIPALGYDGTEDFRLITRSVSNLSGNHYEANSTNLTIKRSAGSIYKEGLNFQTSSTLPSAKSTSAEAPSSFPRWYVNTSSDLVEESASTSNIDPAYYNNTTTGALAAVGSTEWSIQRIFTSAWGGTFVMYGQEKFTDYDDAQAALGSETFITPDLVTSFGVYRYALIVRGGATNLSLEADAVFFEVTAIGGLGGGGGGGGTDVHNDLTGLQGGTTSQYYHFTSAKYSALNNFGSLSNVTPASGDRLIVEDASDSFNNKYSTAGHFINPKYLLAVDSKSTGTNAGGSTASTWVQRNLNTEVYNDISGASVSSNSISLPAGSYLIRAEAPANEVDRHRIRVYNVTDTAVVDEPGRSAMCGYVFEATQTTADVIAYLNISSTKTIRIDHWCARTVGSYGLGKAVSDGDSETYLQVWITRRGDYQSPP